MVKFNDQLNLPIFFPPVKASKSTWVLLYLSDAKTLRGEESRRSYQVGLNAFFHFIDCRDLSLGGYAAEQFVRHLKEEGKSVFTIN